MIKVTLLARGACKTYTLLNEKWLIYIKNMFYFITVSESDDLFIENQHDITLMGFKDRQVRVTQFFWWIMNKLQ